MSEGNPFPILLGSRVTVDLIDVEDDVERREFIIVAEEQADFKSGLLGERTPLGRALLGRRAGELVAYPVGDLKAVRILGVVKTNMPVSGEAAEKRRSIVQEAANQAEIISQLIFATARGSKWGEYDVDVDKLLKNSRDDTAQGNKNSAEKDET